MKLSRRHLAALLPALAAAQSKKETKEKGVLPSKSCIYEDLAVKKSANGNEQREGNHRGHRSHEQPLEWRQYTLGTVPDGSEVRRVRPEK